MDNSGSRAMTATTGHLGASYVVTDAFTPYASWSTAFETPTTTELDQKPDGTGGFNASLGPAQIHTIEAGARGNLGSRVTYTFSAFRLTEDNAIIQYLQIGLVGVLHERRADPERRAGDRARRDAVAAGRSSNLAWTEANYRFVRYIFPAGAVIDTLNGKKLSGVPDHFVRAGRAHALEPLDARRGRDVELVDVRGRPNTQLIKSWGSGDLSLRATWTSEVGSVRAPAVRVGQQPAQPGVHRIGDDQRGVRPHHRAGAAPQLLLRDGDRMARGKMKTEDGRRNDRKPKTEIESAARTPGESRADSSVRGRGSKIAGKGAFAVRPIREG